MTSLQDLPPPLTNVLPQQDTLPWRKGTRVVRHCTQTRWGPMVSKRRDTFCSLFLSRPHVTSTPTTSHNSYWRPEKTVRLSKGLFFLQVHIVFELYYLTAPSLHTVLIVPYTNPWDMLITPSKGSSRVKEVQRRVSSGIDKVYFIGGRWRGNCEGWVKWNPYHETVRVVVDCIGT